MDENYTVSSSNGDVLTLVSFQINTTILIVGFFGNLSSIYVYLQGSMRKHKFNCYLLLMTIFELIFCGILLVDYIFRLVYKKRMFLHDLNVYTNIMIDYLLHLADSYVTILSLIMSIDRIYAFQKPIKINSFITNVHKKLLISASFFTLILLKIPEIVLCYENKTRTFNIIYCTLISPFVITFTPTVIILILNSSLIVKIIKYYKNQRTDKWINCINRSKHRLSKSRRNLILQKKGRQTCKDRIKEKLVELKNHIIL